jgi:hypothetical protein
LKLNVLLLCLLLTILYWGEIFTLSNAFAKDSTKTNESPVVQKPQLGYPSRHAVTPALKKLTDVKQRKKKTVHREQRVVPRLTIPRAEVKKTDVLEADPVVQSRIAAKSSMPATSYGFEGIHNVNGVLPPDTNGDVGPDHYVQTVNLAFAVWDKSGTPLIGPSNLNTLWASLGGICASNNDGDPIVLYDQLADRWLISQFALNFPDDFHQCVAVSATPDPTGSWNLYDFQISTSKMNDYPKFGVWPDGYYMSVNQFDGSTLSWEGVGAVVFERSAMLAGDPGARMIYFDLDESVYPDLGGMLPSDLDGMTAPPSGTPNYFVQLEDDAWGAAQDRLQVWQFDVDWTIPADSTFSLSGYLPTAAFDSDLCGGSRNCIPQPGVRTLDAIADRLMYRLAYRVFDTHQSMVVNHTVDTNGSDHAGIRWYELRDAGSGWTVHQEGTYAPDSDNRWMGSIAMDASGNIGLGYSVSGTSTFPSIRYTGRLASDPSGTMLQGEAEIIAGGGSQGISLGRWGDYSMMGVDPTDDCTFWYTQEYYASDSDAGWQTRIGSFRFPSCTTGPAGTVAGAVTDAATGLPIEAAEVTVGGSTTFSGADGRYTFLTMPVGTYDVTVAAYSYLPQAAPGLVVSDGVTATQDFALDAAATSTISGTVTDGSGQGWPLYARLDIAGHTTPVFNDPTTGAYTVTLFEGATYTFTVNALTGGYASAVRAFVAPAGEGVEDFSLLVDQSCTAQGYSGDAGGCSAIPGEGLLLGNVYDANTFFPLDGADVLGNGRTVSCFGTPDDPLVDEGFYVLSLPEGASIVTASAVDYGPYNQSVTVTAGETTQQDFQLDAGQIDVQPNPVVIDLVVDGTTARKLILENSGNLPVNFSTREINAPYQAPAASGPFALHGRRVSPKHINDTTAGAVYDSNPPAASPLAAGDVIGTWSSGIEPWGIGIESTTDELWLGNADTVMFDYQNYNYLSDGMATGDTIDTSSWRSGFAADMAFDPLSHRLWQVNVGGDNCIYEMDPVTFVSTGDRICPSFGTSERGLAFDPKTGTFYSGSWTDGVIHHFDAAGTILDSVDVGLNIAGLAYNPGTEHLFALVNSSVGFDVYVLDANTGYSVIGGFDIPGVGASEQAAMGIDCDGHLWIVNQSTNEIIEADSGESDVCESLDIPWLSPGVTSGSVPGTDSLQVDLAFDATGLDPGQTYEAHLRILNDTPYGDILIPVTLTVLSDSDGDSLSDTLENDTGTDPADADSDDDGIPDGVEDANQNGLVEPDETDPRNVDSDNDGIQDGTEEGYTLSDITADTDTTIFIADADPLTTTDPLSADTDDDGFSDGVEDVDRNGRLDPGEWNPNDDTDFPPFPVPGATHLMLFLLVLSMIGMAARREGR